MNEVLQTNVFFVITSVAVIVLTVLVIVLLVYGIKIARDAQHISRKIRQQADAISGDLDEVRAQAKHLSPLRTAATIITTLVSGVVAGTKKRSPRKSKVRDDEVEYEESEHAARRRGKQ